MSLFRIFWSIKISINYGRWGNNTEDFQLTFKSSSISDHFLNSFEPPCTPPDILAQATQPVTPLCDFCRWRCTAEVSGWSTSKHFKLLIFRLFDFWVSLPCTKLCWLSSPYPMTTFIILYLLNPMTSEASTWHKSSLPLSRTPKYHSSLESPFPVNGGQTMKKLKLYILLPGSLWADYAFFR